MRVKQRETKVTEMKSSVKKNREAEPTFRMLMTDVIKNTQLLLFTPNQTYNVQYVDNEGVPQVKTFKQDIDAAISFMDSLPDVIDIGNTMV